MPLADLRILKSLSRRSSKGRDVLNSLAMINDVSTSNTKSPALQSQVVDGCERHTLDDAVELGAVPAVANKRAHEPQPGEGATTADSAYLEGWRLYSLILG